MHQQSEGDLNQAVFLEAEHIKWKYVEAFFFFWYWVAAAMKNACDSASLHMVALKA